MFEIMPSGAFLRNISGVRAFQGDVQKLFTRVQRGIFDDHPEKFVEKRAHFLPGLHAGGEKVVARKRQFPEARALSARFDAPDLSAYRP